MRYLIALLILPSLLMAGGFKVNTPEGFTQPANTIDRVSKRTLNSKTFEIDSIGSGKFISMIGLSPIHYDSAGKMVELNFELTDTTGEFSKIVRTGKFSIAYNEAGAIRFEQKQGFVEFLPAFTGVGIEFNIHAHGLKANYFLDADSPNRLAWGFNFTSVHENQGQGKGRIKNAVSKIVAELGELKAWDAAGMVVGLTVNYTADSLIVLVDTAGVTFPVTVDPTVNDTAIAADSMCVNFTAGPITDVGWYAARFAPAAAAFTPSSIWAVNAHNASGSNFIFYRTYFTFDLSTLSTNATSIESAELFLQYASSDLLAAGGDSLVFILGTWVGPFEALAQWNDFEGWDDTDSSAIDFIPLMENMLIPFETTATGSVLFTAAGRDTLLTLMDSGVLKLAALNANEVYDIKDYTQGEHGIKLAEVQPYIVINFTAPAAIFSHVTTGATDPDTLKVTGLAPQIAMGGTHVSGADSLVLPITNDDSVGFVMYLQGVHGDTLTTSPIYDVTDSTNIVWSADNSSFFITSSIDVADTLDIDTFYIVNAFASTAGTRLYSDVEDTVSTYLDRTLVTPSTSQIVWTIVELAANVTAFGTTPVTVRGIAYFLNQEDREADVDTALDAGSSPFAAGVFSLEVTVPVDTFVIYRGIATTVTGDTVSVWDTLRTTAAGAAIDGVPITVMGLQGTRSVN